MGRGQDQWHEELDKINTSLHRLALDVDEQEKSVILDRLKRPTDVYLKKKRWSLTSVSREDRLIALLRRHSDKPVALLSCAHALSKMTVRSLLATPIELNVNLTQDSSISKYLGLIATIHCINNAAVSPDEAKRARVLILLLEKKSSTFLHNLRDFFSTEDPLALYDLLPPGSLEALLGRLCLTFAGQLDALKNQCDWAAAFNAVDGLSNMSDVPQALDILLNNTIGNLRAWISWQPVLHRIRGRDTLTIEQRNELLDVIVLDGPDFRYERHRSFLDALLYQAASQGMNHVCHGPLFVLLDNDVRMDAWTLVNRVLDFPSGPRLSMPGAVEVFILLCLRNAVDINTLRILKEANSLGNPSVYRWLSDIFFSSTSSVRSHAVMELLRMTRTSRNHSLPDLLSGYIKDTVQEDFQQMQNKLCDLMENQRQRNPQSTALQLQALGQSLTEPLRLRRALDQHTQLLLDEWPSEQEIDASFQLRTEVARAKIGPSLETIIDRYCTIRLTGRGNLDQSSRRTMAALLWHWQEQPHVPRRTLALSTMSCSTLPLSLQIECLMRIRDMDDDHLKDLNNIVCSATEMACTRLARLICSRRFLRYHEQGCWKQVLMCMMEQRRETLLDHTVSHMDVKTWFEWLGHLRKIFNIRDGSPSGGQPILQPQLHSWSHFLESGYQAVLSRLELKGNTGLLVQSSLRDWEHRNWITKVLDFFVENRENDPRHPLLEAIDRLGIEGRNVDGQAWDSLAAIASPTP